MNDTQSTRMLSIVFLIALLLGSMSGTGRAQEDAITFHLVCEQMSDECLSIPILSEIGQSILIIKEPLMTLSRDRVRDAEWVTDRFGSAQIQITLTKEAAEQLGQVSGDNVGRRIAIVEDGKTLIAPRINSSITNGVFFIGGNADVCAHLQSIDWLKKLAAETVALKNKRPFTSISVYLWLVVLVLVGGSIYFAFFRKRSVVE